MIPVNLKIPPGFFRAVMKATVVKTTMVTALATMLGLALPLALPAVPGGGFNRILAQSISVGLQRVGPAQGFNKPVHLAPVPDGSGDLVVVEQRGMVMRFPSGAGKSGSIQSRVYLDIRNRVSSGGWEEGLLSIAFHPGFRSNRTFFVVHSASSPRRSVIARYREGASGRKETVLEIPQPYSNHNGGQIAFGPDGMLYIALGDGGAGGDPLGHGQNLRTLLGTILRIDVDRREQGKPYAIPPGNPFASDSHRRNGSRPEIWAYGLRNPWRFSFDKATGRLFAADVGQNRWEEVNIIAAGKNYGWNIMEGAHCFRPPAGCGTRGLERPLTEYSHREGQSITGGFVYRGKAIVGLAGHYLFADYSSGTIWTVPAAPSRKERPQPPRVLLKTSLSISSFGEDLNGELYLLDHGGGGVHRIVPSLSPR